jgi:hypothetical protein
MSSVSRRRPAPRKVAAYGRRDACPRGSQYPRESRGKRFSRGGPSGPRRSKPGGNKTTTAGTVDAPGPHLPEGRSRARLRSMPRGASSRQFPRRPPGREVVSAPVRHRRFVSSFCHESLVASASRTKLVAGAPGLGGECSLVRLGGATSLHRPGARRATGPRVPFTSEAAYLLVDGGGKNVQV